MTVQTIEDKALDDFVLAMKGRNVSWAALANRLANAAYEVTGSAEDAEKALMMALIHHQRQHEDAVPNDVQKVARFDRFQRELRETEANLPF